MAIKVTKTDVWAADIEDRPGGLAELLGTLAEAGANLECVIARRQSDDDGAGGVVFVTPLKGKRVRDAATSVGFRETQRIATLKIEGTDRPGFGAQIARAVGDAGISMRGATGAVIGRNFVCYLGFDSAADAQNAAAAIRKLDKRK